MRRTRFVLSAVAVVLGLLALAPEAGAGGGKPANPAPHEIAVFFEVEFADPMAWDCKTNDTCLTCKNISGSTSDVVITHTPAANEEDHPVSAGLEVRICGNVAYLPHSD